MLTSQKRVLQESWKPKKRNPFGEILGNTALLSLIGLLNRSLTVVTQILIASQFGATIAADAYSATEIVPDLFIVLIGSGLSMAFIPFYSQLQQSNGQSNQKNNHPQADEQHFANAFICSVTLIFLLLTLLLFLAAPLVISLLAPGFEGAARTTTISLFRVMVLTLAFLGPESGLRGIFHTHREFATPDLSRFAYNSVLLIAVFFFSSRFGIQSIGWGMVAGAAVMISIQMWRAVQLGLFKFEWRFRHPAIGAIMRKTPAVLIILAWPMIMFVLDRSAASGLAEGNLAALGYANRISLLPIGILVLPLSTVLYPGFSDLANQGEHKKIGEQISIGLRMLLFIVMPVCVGLLIGRHEIVRLLFERGQFDAAATLNTSNVLFYYILVVPGYAMVFFLRGIYLSMDKPWSLCLISVAMWGANILLNLGMVRLGGAQGVTLGTAILATIAPILMLYNLKQMYNLPIQIGPLLLAITKTSVLAAGMALLLNQIVQIGNQYWADVTMMGQFSILIVGGFFSLAIYLLFAWLFKFSEINWVIDKLPFKNSSSP